MALVLAFCRALLGRVRWHCLAWDLPICNLKCRPTNCFHSSNLGDVCLCLILQGILAVNLPPIWSFSLIGVLLCSCCLHKRNDISECTPFITRHNSNAHYIFVAAWRPKLLQAKVIAAPCRRQHKFRVLRRFRRIGIFFTVVCVHAGSFFHRGSFHKNDVLQLRSSGYSLRYI